MQPISLKPFTLQSRTGTATVCARASLGLITPDGAGDGVLDGGEEAFHLSLAGAQALLDSADALLLITGHGVLVPY
jgi:hypothetical protein